MKTEGHGISGGAAKLDGMSGSPTDRNKTLGNQRPQCPVGAAMFSEYAWQQIARSLKLSGRELQIVRAVFDDHTEFAIAAMLQVSPHTIHTYSERLYRKLAVTNRVKLVLRVMDEFIALTVAAGNMSHRASAPPGWLGSLPAAAVYRAAHD